MLSTLKHIVTERWTSSNWWNAVIYAIVSFIAFRLRILTLSAYCLNQARAHYALFFKSRKVRLIEKLSNLEGVHKFMAVVASPNPETGEEETQVIWTKAESAAKATQNILSGGKLLRIVTLTGGGKREAIEEAAKRKFSHVLEDVTKTWLVEKVKRKTTDAKPKKQFILPKPVMPAPEPKPQGTSILSTIIQNGPKLKRLVPVAPCPPMVQPKCDECGASNCLCQGNNNALAVMQSEPAPEPAPFVPGDWEETFAIPTPPREEWTGHKRMAILSFRKGGEEQVHSQPMSFPVDKAESPLERAAKAIETLRDMKPHLRNITIIPVGLVTMDVAPNDGTGYARFNFDTTAHVFKGEWAKPTA